MGAATRGKAGAIDLRGLCFSHGHTRVLADLSCTIRAGEHVAIIGRSGAGKSTLLHLIAGLLRPASGQTLIDGARVDSPARGVVLMFQRPALLPWASAADNILLPLRFSGDLRRDPRAALHRVHSLLAQIGLADRADASPTQLSGGQQQRVALARSLVTDPTLLLLDEPLGALDKNLRERMQFELRQLQRRIGITSILVTHDQEEALTMSDRVAVMEHGDIVQVGPPAEVYERPKTRFVSEFLGTSNFLTGKVEGGAAAGEWEIAFQQAGTGLIATPAELVLGQIVSIAVRPENLRFAPAGARGLAAKIQDVVFRGNYYAYEVKLRGCADPLFVYTQAKAQLPPDGEVVLDWSSDKAIFIGGGTS
jgi:putative spermidine/putrescine transport system ATP-binding protein